VRFSKVKHLYLLFIVLFSQSLDVCLAENCKKYRAKTDNVPVYSRPSVSSARLKALKEGQEVCYIGEMDGFAIVDLRGPQGVDRRIKQDEVAYVKLFDLWEPEPKKQKKQGQRDQVQEFFNFWRQGGIPDDPIAPFRSLWGGAGPEMKCEAGKICEKVKEKLESAEH
jgi:hypothetical protein